jgi:hypothetical protein
MPANVHLVVADRARRATQRQPEAITMLVLHQLHKVPAAAATGFEANVRDRWLPAVASIAGARLAWYAASTDASRFDDEIATITAFADERAFEEFAAGTRDGALAPIAADLRSQRDSVQTRLLKPIDYDPWSVAVDDIPNEPQDGDTVVYMHDFVSPVRGQMTAYVDMMRERYMALSDQALSGVVLRASWRTVAGGGPVPEMFNLSEIRDIDALVNLFVYEIPREYKEMGTWMWEALATRDRWTTRLLRCASWSPVR